MLLILFRHLCSFFSLCRSSLTVQKHIYEVLISWKCHILHFVLIVRQGCEVSVRELDALLSLLAERKRILEQEEAERNMQILLDLLQYLRKQRVDELNEVRRYSAHLSRNLCYKLGPTSCF